MSATSNVPAGAPSTVPTLVASIFIPLVGLILAIIHGNKAKELGGTSGPYWKNFAIGFVINIVIGIVLQFFVLQPMLQGMGS